MKIQKQAGFTIVELMIATTIFSLVLMICLAGVMQITKMYYGSITKNQTREVARTIVDELAETIRYSSDTVTLGVAVDGPQVSDTTNNNAGVGYFCVGQVRYTFAIDRQVDSDASTDTRTKKKRHALWRDRPTSCTEPADLNQPQPTADGKEMLGEHMRLYRFSIVEKDPANKIYEVAVGVAYGDDDLLFPRPEGTPTELSCEGSSFVGTEFCATTNFIVTVQKRI